MADFIGPQPRGLHGQTQGVGERSRAIANQVLGGDKARCPAHDLGINFCSAGFGQREFFQHKTSGALAQHHALSVGVEGSGSPRGIVVSAARQLFGLRGVNRFHLVNARAGCAGDHPIGAAARDGAIRFVNGQVRRGFAHGERVARAAQVVEDGDVAARHVRQILEHPERVHFGQAIGAPAVVVELGVLRRAFLDARGEFVRFCEHVVRPEDGAVPFGLVLFGRNGGVANAAMGRDDGHLCLSTHDLQTLADHFLLLFVELAEIFGVAGELTSNTPDIRREAAGVERIERS